MKKKRILMVSPIPSHPQTAGNRARIYNLAHAIRQLGHELHFVHVELDKGDTEAMMKCWGENSFFSFPYTRSLTFLFKLKRKFRSFINPDSRYVLPIDAWYDDTVNARLKELYRKYRYDVVFVEYAFFSKALRCFPKQVIKILDTHDVLTDRHKAYIEKLGRYAWFSTTAAQEKKGLRRADIVVAIQDLEREFFSGLIGKQTVTIGHTVKTKKQVSARQPKGVMLFIGSANHSNMDALKFFMDDIYPGIKRVVPGAVLRVAGPICNEPESNREGIVRLGIPEDLDAVYEKTDIVINPVRYGTGLKIKNIEALGYSKPLVTTSVGAEGMETGVSTSFLVADDAQGFSEAVIKVINDTSLFQSLCNQAYDFSVAWNRKQTDTLKSIIQ